MAGERAVIEFEVDREDGLVVLAWRENGTTRTWSITPISARSLSLALREASRGRESEHVDVFPVQVVLRGDFNG